MFGGSAEPWAGSDDQQTKLADTTLLQFSELLYIYTPSQVYIIIHINIDIL